MTALPLRARAQEQAELCGVFANATRILIFWTLVEHEKSVGEIAEAIDASLQSTSQHLRIMKQRNVLRSRRNGQMIYYRISEQMGGCRHFLETARLGVRSPQESSKL
ncbi:MAG: ArsR/SmtB family transcription factor [Chloroflexota bacterium]